MSKREEFQAAIDLLSAASQSISADQRIGLLQQAVRQYGLSIDEADDILKSSGLVVGENLNYFKVLGLSLEKIQNLSDDIITKYVEAAHKKAYSDSLRAGGLPRPDGRTQDQWRNLLNQARDTLIDTQKRNEHIKSLRSKNETSQHIDHTTQIDTHSVEQRSLELAIPLDMALIPAGEFQMGNDSEKSNVRERPVHTVYVDAYYMDIYPVTNKQFQMFLEANPRWSKPNDWQWYDPSKWHELNRKDYRSIDRKFHDGDYLKNWKWNYYQDGKGDYPVTHVSWYAAMAYAEWAGKRLPTEAEWENAARGGLIAQKYPWGNRIAPNKVHCGKNVGETLAVGKYSPNAYGLYDMVGNVWEWCLDEYDHNFYESSPLRNPVAGVNEEKNLKGLIADYRNIKSDRVMRGGTMFSSSEPCQTSSRWGGVPYITSFLASYYPKYIDSMSLTVMANIGFRCVKDVGV